MKSASPHLSQAKSPAGYHPKRQIPITLFPVTFRYHAPHAKGVAVVGSFDPGKPHLMQRSADHYWHLTVPLKRGRYEYHFVVDGRPTFDPKARGTITAADGHKYSLLEVGF